MIMDRDAHPGIVDPRSRVFDVVCAGEARLEVAGGSGAGPLRMQIRAGGGAVEAAMALAAQGLRVGLATVLADDAPGRALHEKLASRGIDVGGVQLGKRGAGLVLVRGGARQVLTLGEEPEPPSVPAGWSSRVLLLSGVTPGVAHAGALAKAARAARRAGSLVVLDLDVRWELWRGREPRVLRMVLQEADVVWSTAQDLVDLGMGGDALRASMRRGAVLVSSDGVSATSATGPFGELAQRLSRDAATSPVLDRGAFTVAIASELARSRGGEELSGDLWLRTLQRAHAVATQRAGR